MTIAYSEIVGVSRLGSVVQNGFSHPARKLSVAVYDIVGGGAIRPLIDVQFFYGQATKGVRWMPRQREAMKDAVSCDKLR